MGVTCNTTAKGKNERSTQRERANKMASATPPTVAASRASKVICKVTSSEPDSVSQSFTSVTPISEGEGST